MTGAVHDALLADDIDDTIFEQGLLPEILVSWCDLRDWWSFWRQGVHTKHSIGVALRTAYDLGLFDARWFLEVVENGRVRGTDVLIEGLTKVFFPEASNTVIFVIMAIVLLIRPAGLFGRTV